MTLEVKLVPLSDKMTWGLPCRHMILVMMKLAVVKAVTLQVALALTHFEKWFIATMMKRAPLELGGRGPATSMLTVWKACLGSMSLNSCCKERGVEVDSHGRRQ